MVRPLICSEIPPGIELAQLVDRLVEVRLGRAPLPLRDPGVRDGLVHAQPLLGVDGEHLADQVLGLVENSRIWVG